VGHLASIEIYDTDSGSVYTTQDNEILFEPPLLALIQELINAADRIELILVGEIDSQPSQKPVLPPAHLATKAATWYGGIKSSLTNPEIDTGCKWDKTDQEKLDALTKRLAEANPAEEAKKLRKHGANITALANTLASARASLSDEALAVIANARTLLSGLFQNGSEALGGEVMKLINVEVKVLALGLGPSRPCHRCQLKFSREDIPKRTVGHCPAYAPFQGFPFN
jgi:hypothetical protein